MKFSVASALRNLRDRARGLWSDARAMATVEFAMVTPAMLSLTALVVFAAQGFELQRKVTLTMRTLTDLVTQQSAIGTTTATSYTYSQILAAASLVMAPYDASQMQMVITEIQTNGTTSGKVIWSQATGTGATAYTAGSSITVPSNLTSPGYLIYGTVSYNYNPLQIFLPSNAITLSDSIYMSPRVSGSIQCCS